MYRTAVVVVENASLPFDREYTYLIPGELADAVAAGGRVTVPFGRGNRRRTGLVLSTSSIPEREEGMKPLLEAVDREPLLNEEGLLLLRFLKEQTFCTWFDAFRLLVPAGLGIARRRVYGTGDRAALLEPGEQAVVDYLKARGQAVEEKTLCDKFGVSPQRLAELAAGGILSRGERQKQRVRDETVCMAALREDRESLPLTPKQKLVVDFLEQNGPVSLKELCYYTATTRAVADGLRKKGQLAYQEIPRLRTPYGEEQEQEGEEIRLSAEQNRALERLVAFAGEENPRPALLYGVTGSGKTQVFLRLMEHVLAGGRQVIVLVPEISLTPQTVRGFQRRFGARVAVLHSGLSLGERMDEWKRIREGGADIVVGTRSAVFAPLERLGLIVMDEEQDGAYKSEQSPRFHAREVAHFRCRRHGALLLLASATPSVESFHKADKGEYRLLTLEERFGDAVLPEVIVVDMKEAENLSQAPAFSQLLLEELRYNLEHGEQSILLLNRRGYSTVVKCSACGTAADCPHCSVALTYHAANNSLLCHTCGYVHPRINSCSHCGSDLVRYSGAGTQKLEEELKGLFPDARILRVDMDTTMTKFSHEKLFGAFYRREYDIMIGTQMVAKGLNFPRVTLVGVLNADQSLYGGDFRSYERSFALLTQVVGRSGRGGDPGRAVVQTYTPESPVIRLAARQDYQGFYHQEILSRKLHLYPPFCAMAGIGFVGEDMQEVLRWARSYLEQFRKTASASYADLPLRLLGPAPFDIVKAAGKYRYKLLLKCRANRATRRLLEEMNAWFYRSCKRVSIFVDWYYDRM